MLIIIIIIIIITSGFPHGEALEELLRARIKFLKEETVQNE